MNNLNVSENAELNLEMEELTEHTPASAEVFNERFEQVLNNEANLNKNKADKSKYGDNVVSVGRRKDTNVGDKSFAFGNDVKASGDNSHAEGDCSSANEDCAHAEGERTNASGYASHSEGSYTTASGNGAHAEGCNTNASGDSSHAEGYSAVASGDYSHAEGMQTEASVGNSHAEGSGTKASGNCSHAEGDSTIASGDTSHAEGYNTTASGYFSHAEGNNTKANGPTSHTEGDTTTASGSISHAEGSNTTAIGYCSHAEGNNTKASGDSSHAEGYYTIALKHQHAQGHYNNTTIATENSTSGTSKGTALVIGNGTSSSRSNAFRVTGEGKVYATNTSISTGADYAEYFEWSDENPNNEDRVGYFVTFDEDNEEKIRIANKEDYVLGIISGQPCVLGNGDEDWKKRYILDDFGRYIQETFEYEVKEVDKETGEEITVTKTGTKWKENPDYDQTKPYIPRDQRQEWSAVGMLGVLSVYDDGTCKVNGYCKCADGGIATASENGYRVIKRVTGNIVKVVFR